MYKYFSLETSTGRKHPVDTTLNFWFTAKPDLPTWLVTTVMRGYEQGQLWRLDTEVSSTPTGKTRNLIHP